MNKRLMVAVTRKDIKAGKRLSSRSCPVALAIVRATGCAECHVDLGSIFVVRNDPAIVTLEMKQPKKVSRFVRAFDHGEGAAKPFRFQLNLT